MNSRLLPILLGATAVLNLSCHDTENDLCPYYDGQMVRILNIDDDNDALNNKYGIINNKNYKDNKKNDECVVKIDNKDYSLKVYVLIKIPTIFINGENHDLVNEDELQIFIDKHSDDLIGLEYGDHLVRIWKNMGYPIYRSENVFGFDNENMKQLNVIQSSNENFEPHCQTYSSKCMWDIISKLNDEMLDQIGSRFNVNFKELRDMIQEQDVELSDDYYEYLNARTGFSNEDIEDIIDFWLELTKDYLTNTLNEDEFVDDKFNFIYTELVDDWSNIFDDDLYQKINICTMTRDVLSSFKIVEEYVTNYKEGKNIYISVGNDHVKVLQHLIQQRLLLKHKDNDTPTHVTSQQIFHWRGEDDNLNRNGYFMIYAAKTGQRVDSEFLLS